MVLFLPTFIYHPNLYDPIEIPGVLNDLYSGVKPSKSELNFSFTPKRHPGDLNLKIFMVSLCYFTNFITLVTTHYIIEAALSSLNQLASAQQQNLNQQAAANLCCNRAKHVLVLESYIYDDRPIFCFRKPPLLSKLLHIEIRSTGLKIYGKNL